MNSPPVATATLSLSRVSHAGGTASGFKARIIDHCFHEGIEITDSKARKLAVRMKRRADRMNEEFDFFAEMKILGMTSDPTARDAIRRIA